MRKLLTAALLAVLTVTGAGIALADEEVGPGTTACSEAGTAVAAGMKILTAKSNLDKATTAADTAAAAVATAQAVSDKAGTANGVAPLADRAAAASRVAAIDTYLAGDPALTDAQKTQFKAERDAAAALITALDAKTTAAAAKATAETAFADAGGTERLGKLAVAGGISALIADQREACGEIDQPAPPAPAPSGSFSQVGNVPAGGVETGA